MRNIRISAGLFLLLLTVAFTGCKESNPSDPGDPCTSNLDCPGTNEICGDNGRCVIDDTDTTDGGEDIDEDIEETEDVSEDIKEDIDTQTDTEIDESCIAPNSASGCSCVEDAECTSGLCISTGTGTDVCTNICQTDADCGDDFQCKIISSGGDVIEVCVPIGGDTCRSCQTAIDCEIGSTCYDDIEDGSACVPACTGNDECAEGYSCKTIQDPETSDAVQRCIPDLGICGACLDRDNDGYGEGQCPEEGVDCDDNNAAANPGAVEVCDNVDNNCDGVTDEGFVDPVSGIYNGDAHCGSCNNDCDDALAANNVQDGVCTDQGVCVAADDGCATPFLNCSAEDGGDGNPATCEIDGSFASKNCGGCGIDCADAGVGFFCDAGLCVETQCVKDFLITCPDDAQACQTDIRNDPENCGGCGQSCEGQFANATAFCSQRSCGVDACFPGFADCDRDLSGTGCEIDITTTANCGACGVSCGDANTDSSACVAGADAGTFACELDCAAGFSDCNGNPADGCEVDLRDPAYCGTCDGSQACAGTFRNAAAGCDLIEAGDPDAPGDYVCFLDECNDGFLDCDNDQFTGCEVRDSAATSCGGCGCADPNDVDSCFNCNTLNPTSTNFQCVENETNPEDRSYFCEDTGCVVGTGVCPGSPLCVSLGQDTVCSGGCNNCTTLANTTGGSCVGDANAGTSECQIGGCAADFCDYDGDALNGCEVNITNTASCSSSCSDAPVNCGLQSVLPNVSGPFCDSGVCNFDDCANNFNDCDGVQANGCEARTTDIAACGDDCTDCTALRDDPSLHVDQIQCAGGERGCIIVSCDMHFEDCDGNALNGCEVDLRNPTTCGACRQRDCTDLVSGTIAAPGCNFDETLGDYRCSYDCADGFDDCDGGTPLGDLNGCEINTDTNVQNCGLCGNRCQYANGVALCDGGTCDLQSCNVGFFDCFSDDTCVDLTDDDTCGSGCIACDDQPGVENGICIDTSSSTSFSARCDADICELNFCEIDTNLATCESIRLTNQCAPTCLDDVRNCQVDVAGAFGAFCDTAGICDYGNCAADRVDCDSDRTNGCEADRFGDTTCGSTCTNCVSLASGDANTAGGTCNANGRCEFTCEVGYADCDPGVPGCETDLSDPTSCGACGRNCNQGVKNVTSGSIGCDFNGPSDFECTYTCDATHGDCDGNDINGCETRTDNDEINCGGCGVVCLDELDNVSDAACIASTCRVTECQGVFRDCNTTPADGCETNLSQAANCGACGTVCDATNATSATCSGAGQDPSGYSCNIQCQPGFADCNNNPNDGCEVDLSDVGSCGTCTTNCLVGGVVPNATPICDDKGTPAAGDNVCAVGTCNAGSLDCTPAAGCETPTADPQNCGQCGRSCPALSTGGTNFTCSDTGGGAFDCVATSCAPGFVDCGSGCQSLKNDNACGSCSTDCDNLSNTLDGVCSTSGSGSGISYFCEVGTCDAGFCDLDGLTTNGCENPLTNTLFCGPNDCSGSVNCNTQVNNAGGITCSGGACDYGSCSAGFADCDTDATNGCEASTSSKDTCTTACLDCDDLVADPSKHVASLASSGSQCDAGNGCNIECDANYGNCNSNSADGCERQLNSSQFCGSCGNDCANVVGANAIPMCGAGPSGNVINGCGVGGCTSGFVDIDEVVDNGCECEILPGRDEPGDGIDSNCDGVDGDEAFSFFVAKPANGGSNSNVGTRDSPFATINKAIAEAQTCAADPSTGRRCDVYVSAGNYDEAVSMSTGVSVFGGYSASNWTLNYSTNTTTIRGNQRIALTANGIVTPISLDGFTIVGRSSVNDSSDTIAIAVVNSASNVSLTNLTVEAGEAGVGAAGSVGSPGADGVQGGNGAGTAIGVGGASACGAIGGNGGQGRSCGNGGGQRGQNGSAGGDTVIAGGAGSAGSNAGGGFNDEGGTGGNGSAGGNGSGGNGGTALGSVFGSFTGLQWTNGSGGSGTRGANGTGGGGGGSGGCDSGFLDSADGLAGGGGGSAGCGATAGSGGEVGRISVGILINNSTPVISNVVVSLGRGGRGGNGGNGGDGGSAGGSGSGQSNTDSGFNFEGDPGSGGNGGNGGAGAGGGGGAGGNGGPAIGVALINTTQAQQNLGSIIFDNVLPSGGNGGLPGSGGLGGRLGGSTTRAATGNSGLKGGVAEVREY